MMVVPVEVMIVVGAGDGVCWYWMVEVVVVLGASGVVVVVFGGGS